MTRPRTGPAGDRWVLSAACRGHDPDLWFPNDQPSGMARAVALRLATAVCAACPVLFDCRVYADRQDIRHGVWGGRLRERGGR